MKFAKPTLSDKIVGFFSPKAEFERLKMRAASSIIKGESGFARPGSRNRSMRGWTPQQNDADADTIPGLAGMRAGSRDLFMNTPVAAAILRRMKTKVIGPGLMLQSRIDRNVLGLSQEAADSWERNTEREFKLWASSVECDASRSNDFYGLQALAFLSMLMNGDVFVAMPFLDKYDSDYKLALRLIESDSVSNPQNQMDTIRVAGGVEVNENGAAVRYHIKKYPQNLSIESSQFEAGCTWSAIEAYGSQSKRRNILHLMTKERVGQRRGVPLLANVFERLKNSGRLEESELTAALVASMLTVFITDENPGSAGTGILESFTQNEKVSNTGSSEDKNNLEMGYGSVVQLAKGQSIEVADSKRPNGAFDPFFTAIIKTASAACEMPYELVMQHFQASYSATRGVIVEAGQFVRDRRLIFSRDFCTPVYQEWMTEAILRGKIVAPGFFENRMVRMAWLGAKWTGPSQGQIDPLKETEAAKLRIDSLLSTYEDEANAASGSDWDSLVERSSREQRKIKDLGLEKKDVKKEKSTEPEKDGENGLD